MKKEVIILILFQIQVLCGMAQCPNNLLVNGSFSSIKGENITAPGWTSSGTPDINDEIGPLQTSPGYVWFGLPLASTDSGTWQNLFYNETVSQSVNVIQGQTYYFCIEYASQSIDLNGAPISFPAGLDIYVDGLRFSTDLDTSMFTWEKICLSFVANSSLATIEIVPSGVEYIAIDGACLSIYDITDVNTHTSLSAKYTYFNPNEEVLNIKYNDSQVYSLFTLYDYLGRIVLKQEINSDTRINIDYLPKGSYVYNLRKDNILVDKGALAK